MEKDNKTMQWSDEFGGYVPAIPEPFWYAGWRTWFRYRPACYQCAKKKGVPLIFQTRAQYDTHYALNHIEDIETGNEHD